MYPSLMKFDPFAELGDFQQQVAQLFGGLGLPSSIRAVRRGAFPAINMGMTDDAVEIYALAPGIDPAKLEVSLDKGLLTIAGERDSDVPADNEQLSVYASERFNGTFRRVVSLPEDVDADQVNATYRNGVLSIIVPKRAGSKARHIEVQNIQ